MRPGGIRGRVALAAALATAVVILLGGGLVTVLVGVTEHSSLDKRLAEQATAVQSDVLAQLRLGNRSISADLAASRPDVGTVIRVYSSNALVGSVGSTDVTFPPPGRGGYNTVPAGGRTWRVLDRYIDRTTVLQTAVPSNASDELADTLRRRILQVAAVSALIAASLGWYFGSVAIRPLARLRRTSEDVANSRDLAVRVPDRDGPREVDDLANSFNVMLERLQEAASSTEAALESSRAFAGNAAHEMRTPLTSMQANLDVLVRNPDLPHGQREVIITSLAQEQRRLVGLLDALHVLARGDVVGDRQKEPMDLSDLVGLSVESIGKHFPDTAFSYSLPSAPTELQGWPDGLRVLVENLLTNAGRHGGTGVEVAIATFDDWVELTVEDDGPGISPRDRDTIFDRFVRGPGVVAPGTGLGLALVAQQARIHGGDVHVTDSDLGGARFVVRLRTS